MEQFHVRVAGEGLMFSAAHFITLDERTCEPLHGHNYRVAAEVHGPLDNSHLVVDFVAVDETLKAIIAQFDHRVILPTESRLIRVNVGEEEVEARFARRRWVFPLADCLLLPIPNTTAELFARHIAGQLREALLSRTGTAPKRLLVELEETSGFSATCELGASS